MSEDASDEESSGPPADSTESHSLDPAPTQEAPEVADVEVFAAAETISGPGQQETVQIRIVSQEWTGPLPHPDALKRFEEVVPGGAERIFRMTEKEQENRHANFTKAIDAETKLGSRGQVYGFIIALFGLAGAIGLGFAGKTVAASIIATGDLVALVTVFVVGRSGTAASPEIRAGQPGPPEDIDA